MRESGRIPGSFAISWEQRKFGEVLETVTDYVAAGSFADLAKNVEYKDYPDYAQLIRTKDLKNGFTSTQEVYVNKNAFDYLYRVNMDKECIILPNIGNCGEVYYVKPESLPYEHNVLGPNAIFVRSETCANNFLSILFQAKDFQTKLKLIVSPNGQTKFNKTELKGIDLILPRDVYEQEKIGQYFSNLDRLITLHQRKLCVLCILERLLYENIKQFEVTVSWEQRKVSDLSEKTFGGGTPKTSNDSFWKGNIPWIQSSDLVEGSLFDVEPRKYISQEAVDKSATKLVPEKSVAIVTRVGVGKLAFMPFSYATSQDFLSLSVLKTEPQFTVYALYKKLQSELNAVQGTSIKGVTKDELLAKEVMIPCYKEQEKIGSYLHFLDHLITLHQRKP